MVPFILSKEYSCKTIDLLDRGSNLIMRFGEGVFSFGCFRDISKDSLRSRERSKRWRGVLVLLCEALSASPALKGKRGRALCVSWRPSEEKVAFGEQMTM